METRIQWHSAFYAALQIELEEEQGILEYEEEHLLGKKPMQIDVVVIKKQRDAQVKKNIGRIFRQYNIIEYKSPDDTLNINDFYKVYGYACFYQSDTEKIGNIDAREITITFVCSHYPRKMLKRLEEERGIAANTYKEMPGIYYLSGDAFPIQLLVTGQLSREENYWLQSLRNNLKAGGEILQLMERYEKKKKSSLYQAVMDVIMRANWKEVEVEKQMCEALKELFAEELRESRESGIEEGIEKGIEEGMEKGIRALIDTFVEFGLSREDILSRIQTKFSLTQEKGEYYLKKFL